MQLFEKLNTSDTSHNVIRGDGVRLFTIVVSWGQGEGGLAGSA